MAHGNAIDAQVRALQQQQAQLQQQIAQRQAEIADADSTDWLQEQARKLGYVFPGEGVYILTGPQVKGPAGGGINAPLPTYAPATPTPVPTPRPTPKPSPTPISFNLASPSPH